MESNKSKNVLLSCVVVFIVACLCLGLVIATGVGVSVFWPVQIETEEVSVATPIIENEIPDNDIVAETPAPDEELPEEIAGIIQQIETQVVQIRGLSPVEPVQRTLISAEELEEIVITEFFSDYTDADARQDVLVLSTLGLLPQDFDLRGFYLELYSEQISGFYDSEAKELFVVRGTTFGGREKLTYAHEYTHALQDQVFQFDEGMNYNEEACEIDSERCAAIRALIEGDATLTEILWFQTHATRQDYADLMEAFENFSSPVLDAAPPYIAADLYFPYEKGLAFVEYLFDQGGFDAVDAAFLDPPVSTQQILHPDKYPDQVPALVELPDLSDSLGTDWELFDQNIMGEWFTFLILHMAYNDSHQLPEDTARQAADGWGGDAYAIYLNEISDDVVFILDMVWETDSDAETFAEAFSDYAGRRWDIADEMVFGNATWRGVEGTVIMALEGDRTLWVIAPEPEMVELILLELQ